MKVKNSHRIDEFLPIYHFNEIHSIHVNASASRCYQAVKTVTPAEISLFVILMTIRSFSLRFARQARGPSSRTVPILSAFLQAGFVLLADEIGPELVLGAVGRFWRPVQRAYPLTRPEEFKAFSVADHVKVAASFLVEGDDETSRVTTETRIFATDEVARRKFAFYWLVIRPGSALIRRDWLKAIRNRAEART